MAQSHSPRHQPHARFASPLRNVLDVLLVEAGCAPAGPRAPLSAVEHLRHFCQYAGLPLGRLSYLRAGRPLGPCIVLLHGTPGSSTGWTDYLLEPPAGAELIALDRPGFGRSTPSNAVTSLALQAGAVAQLLPADGRPAIVVGHSLGAAVATWLAAQLPGRVQGLVLLAGSLDPDLEAVHPAQHVAAWPGLGKLLPRAIRNSNAELLALKQELQLLAPLLQHVRCPVAIVHGTADDLVPAENVRYLQSRLTNARSVTTTLLDGHNHFLPWNSASAVRGALQLTLANST